MSRVLGRVAALALVLALGFPLPVAGHPHVFIDYEVALVLAGDKLEGIRLRWTFDELFSGFLLQEFDADRDRTLSPAEARRIEQKHLAEFREVAYHTTINVNGRAVPVGEAREFRASVARGQVAYQFTLPVRVALAGVTALEVVVDDPVYFIAFTPTTAAPATAAAGQAIECRVTRDRTGATPDAIRCDVKRRGA